MTQLISFHGKPELKQELLAQLQAHYAADLADSADKLIALLEASGEV